MSGVLERWKGCDENEKNQPQNWRRITWANIFYRIYSENIRKGVKQGCPLSPLLFDICVDPLITYIKNAKESGYVTEDLRDTKIQAYADDMVLMSDSEEKLQKRNDFSILQM
jgi:hypothetical protein